ncbi:MAG: hypothetical protein ABIA11_01765 [Patescibacteria group bacterium]
MNSVNRIADGTAIINVFKYDKFGAKVNYSFLFSAKHASEGLIELLMTTSSELKSTPVLVSDSLNTNKCARYTIHNFYDLVGGYVNTGLILIPQLPEILECLGFNNIPAGLDGKPDNLLEIYAKESLQFLLFSPARRYGKDRLFESLPDGVVLGKERTIIQYDSKAYSEGFNFNADDIGRFAKYVNEFNGRYATVLGPVYAFLVISGKFNDSLESVQKRSDDLYKRCLTNLSCITCRELGEMVKIVVQYSEKRHAIDWKTVFMNRMITNELIKKEIQKIRKDKII